MARVRKMNDKYLGKGITISPAEPTKGETARLIYNGLLAKNGATKVYVHVGFGEEWKKSTDYKMIKTGEGFEVAIPVAIDTTMNLCFKDNAENWDNNSGENYSFSVQ